MGRTEQNDLKNEETQSDESEFLKNFYLPWTVEKLLQIDSLDDESHITKVLQDSYALCLTPQARHMFCEHLAYLQSYQSDEPVEFPGPLVYRFLYGFVYETQPDVHDFFTEKVLVTCQRCVVGYHTARRLFLHRMASVYDSSSVINLDNEYFKWDMQRIFSGLQYAKSKTVEITAISTTHPIVDTSCTSLSISTLIPKAQESQSLRFSNALLEVLFRGDYIKTLEENQSLYSELRQLVGDCVQFTFYEDALMLIARTVWDVCHPFLKVVLAHCAHPFQEVSTVSLTLLKCIIQLDKSEHVTKKHTKIYIALQTAIENVFHTWERKILKKLRRCSSYHTSSPLSSEQVQQITQPHMSHKPECVCFTESSRFFYAATQILHSARSIFNETSFITQHTLPLKRAGIHLAIHSCSLNPNSVATFTLEFLQCLKFIQGIPLNQLDEKLLVSLFSVLSTLLRVDTLKNAVICTLEGLLEQLYLGMSDAQKAVPKTLLATLWRPAFHALFTALDHISLPARLKPSLVQGIADEKSSLMEFAQFRVCFWILALDSHVFLPSHCPVSLCTKEILDVEPTCEPLVLQYQRSVIPIVMALVQCSPCFFLQHSDMLSQGDSTGISFPVFLATVLGAILDWALQDFQYEIHALQAAMASSEIIRLKEANRFPRSLPFIKLLLPFVKQQLECVPSTADYATEFVLKHLADLGVLQESFQSRCFLLSSCFTVSWKIVFSCMDTYQKIAHIVLQNMLDRIMHADTFASPVPIVKCQSVDQVPVSSENLVTYLKQLPKPVTLKSQNHAFYDIVESFIKHLFGFLSGCLSASVCSFLEAFTLYFFSTSSASSSLEMLFPPAFDATLTPQRKTVLSVLRHALAQDTEPFLLVTSLHIATELIVNQIHEQSMMYETVNASQCSVVKTKNTYSLPWVAWLTMMFFLLPSLESLYQSGLNHATHTKLLVLLESIVNASWKIVCVIPQDMLYMKKNSSVTDSLLDRSFDDSICYENLKRSSLTTFVLIFLNSWISSALHIMEFVLQSEFYVNGMLQEKPLAHVDAFRHHTQWTSSLLRWCTDIQENGIGELLVQRQQQPEHQQPRKTECALSITEVTSLWKSWRTLEIQRSIESLCTSIAKGMTFVYRHFKDQPVEKGSFYIPLLARGDLPPNLTKKLVEEFPVDHVLNSAKKIEMLNSNLTESVFSKKQSLDPWLSLVHTAQKTQSTPLKQTTVSGSAAKTTQDSLTYRFLKPLKWRSCKPFILKSKKSSRIAESLLRKLGNTKVLSTRSLGYRTRPISLANRKPSCDIPPKIKHSLPTPSTPRLKLPASSSTTLGCTVLASSPMTSGKPEKNPGCEETLENSKNGLKLTFQQRLSSVERALTLESATAHLQDILQTILEWDIFRLEYLVIPELQEKSKGLPLFFNSIEEFRRDFRPLVLEECRCSLVQTGLEKRLEGFPLLVTRSTRLGENTLIVTVRSDRLLRHKDDAEIGIVMDATSIPVGVKFMQDKKFEALPLQPWSLVLLIPQISSEDDDVLEGHVFSDLRTPPKQGYVLGIVEKDDDFEMRVSESEQMVSARLRMPFRPSPQVAQQLRRISSTRVTINSKWIVYTLGSLTTFIREVQSLFVSHLSPLFGFLLHPQAFLTPKEKKELSFAEEFLKNTQDSQGNGVKSLETPPKNQVDFDHPVWKNGPTLSEIQTLCDLNDFQALALFHGLTSEHHVALLQGPPGTGKTHTIWAILAALYYKKEQISEGHLALTTAQTKKKILVCAPSNAAIDEIAFRVLHHGFPVFGTHEQKHFPKCVRLGHPQRITRPEVLSICLSEQVKKEGPKMEYSKKTEYLQHKQQVLSELQTISNELQQLDSVREAECFQAVFDEGHDRKEEKLSPERLRFETQTKKNQLLDKKKKFQLHMNHLKQALKSDLKCTKKVCQETALQQADIVFCTLSGAASECLNGLCIDHAIIDEAAQAVELSTLIPLRLELLRLILIGDPQQLPATVFSRTAKQLSYERSLFQRLQLCGVETKMLCLQYRMHPKIAKFPSLYFYNNNISNAPTVLQRPDLPCHSWKYMFEPFLFFHVPSQETRCALSQSLANHDEALFIVSLVRLLNKQFRLAPVGELSKSEPLLNATTPSHQGTLSWTDISIVAPYRQQVLHLRSLFSNYPQDFPPNLPEISTIDAFQGREKRIIIFSCVRATPFTYSVNQTPSSFTSTSTYVSSNHDASDDTAYQNESPSLSATLGFVADVRRMNVAITRARDCLWIVGNANTLCTNPAWDALIRYAKTPASDQPKESNCFVDILACTRFLCQTSPTPNQSGLSSLTAAIPRFFRLVEQFNLQLRKKTVPKKDRFPVLTHQHNKTLTPMQNNGLSHETLCDMSSCSSVSSSEFDDHDQTSQSPATSFPVFKTTGIKHPNQKINQKSSQDILKTSNIVNQPPLVARKSKSPAFCFGSTSSTDTLSSLMISKKQKLNKTILECIPPNITKAVTVPSSHALQISRSIRFLSPTPITCAVPSESCSIISKSPTPSSTIHSLKSPIYSLKPSFSEKSLDVSNACRALRPAKMRLQGSENSFTHPSTFSRSHFFKTKKYWD